jgi:hypothetical protein
MFLSLKYLGEALLRDSAYRSSSGARVRLDIDPASLVRSRVGCDNQGRVKVDLRLAIGLPSVAVAFAAIDETWSGRCTALECQLALCSAGA